MICDRAGDGNAVGVQTKGRNSGGREKKADERARQTCVELFADGNDDENAEADRHREGIAGMRDRKYPDANDRIALMGLPEQSWQLRGEDMKPDSSEKAGHHWNREKIGDPTQAETAACDEPHAHHQR